MSGRLFYPTDINGSSCDILFLFEMDDLLKKELSWQFFQSVPSANGAQKLA